MLSALSELSVAFPWFGWVAIFVFGACVGSFLNVVILRNPRGQSVLRPGSRCDGCAAPILWRDKLPILAWLFRRGRARCCDARFSFRYCAVELLTALLFLVCWLSFPPLKTLCAVAFLSLLIVASFIDQDHRIIPDWLTIGGAALGLFLSLCVPELHGFLSEPMGSESPVPLAHFRAFASSAAGLFIGSGLLLWIALVAEVFMKKEAMGFGDVKFVGMIGAFCGWQGAVFAIFGGAILGTLFVGALRLIGKRAPNGQIPFGPMLAAAATIYFFGGGTLTSFLGNFTCR
ncbi:hypothetical protein AXK12_04900 [Cephaloticoccus capnophilus]|uniref:Prepilin peptidase n=1 Tax=Cephaloticoccus capnophilus TaxID=1548208 RepID=A0A139SM89_9BACT|nr:A24 family peptidase [Cephaloticoccus capnophilus]KXU35655.1 hypothetical protein AXK12_04900 [Cephaloticoccus capnophilus]